MYNPYDIANYGVSRQPPDHTAQTRSHGTNQVTRDKSGTKRDLQEPNGDPGYGVTVQLINQSHQHSWALMTPPEYSVALMSSHEYGAMVP